MSQLPHFIATSQRYLQLNSVAAELPRATRVEPVAFALIIAGFGLTALLAVLGA